MSDELWNPHWLAFARSLGCDPAELDGSHNAEFVCWVSARLAEFRKETGAGERLDGAELAEFGRYLFRWADAVSAGVKGGQGALF